MRQILAIGVLFTVSLINGALAQEQRNLAYLEEGELEDEFALLEEEDVVYTAARHEQAIVDSPSAVTVITRKQIENTHCSDLVCLLRAVPEVDVLRILPGYSSVGTRALTNDLGNKALVLIDGREISIEIYGIPLWQLLPVHLEDIERVEVIRGPASALYGANAHSMVVSIITRIRQTDGAEVFLGSGEHNRNSLHARVDQHLGNFHIHLSGGLETQDHWRIQDRNERLFERARLRMDYTGQSSTSTVELGLVHIQEGTLFTSVAPGSFRDGITTELLGTHRTERMKLQMAFVLLDGDIHMDMPLRFEAIKLGEFPEKLDIFSTTLDAEAQYNWKPFEGNLFIVGGNYRWITMISDTNTPRKVFQHRIGAFLHNEQKLGEDMTLTTGVRLDYNNITPFTVSPRVAGIYKFAENQTLRLAFGQAFLKPSYYNTSLHVAGVKGEPGYQEIEDFFLTAIGNDELTNESIMSFEAGYGGRFLDGQLAVEVNSFYNRYRDFISFEAEIATNEMGLPDLTASTMKFINTGLQVDSVGASASLTYRMKNLLRANVNYTFRHSFYVSDDPIDTWATGDFKNGDRVPWEPAHLLNLSCQYYPSKGFRGGLSLHGKTSSEMAIARYGGAFDEKIMVSRPASMMVGGFLSWKGFQGSRWMEAGIRVFNLFNAGFRDLPAVRRMDGRELGGELLGRRIFFFLRGSI